MRRNKRLIIQLRNNKYVENGAIKLFGYLLYCSDLIFAERCIYVMASTALTLSSCALITCKTGIKSACQSLVQIIDLPPLWGALGALSAYFIRLVGPRLCRITHALKVCLISRLVSASVLFESKGFEKRQSI